MGAFLDAWTAAYEKEKAAGDTDDNDARMAQLGIDHEEFTAFAADRLAHFAAIYGPVVTGATKPILDSLLDGLLIGAELAAARDSA